jgi:hypothetical protein
MSSWGHNKNYTRGIVTIPNNIECVALCSISTKCHLGHSKMNKRLSFLRTAVTTSLSKARHISLFILAILIPQLVSFSMTLEKNTIIQDSCFGQLQRRQSFQLVITPHHVDHLELQNLSRVFNFRSDHLGMPLLYLHNSKTT